MNTHIVADAENKFFTCLHCRKRTEMPVILEQLTAVAEIFTREHKDCVKQEAKIEDIKEEVKVIIEADWNLITGTIAYLLYYHKEGKRFGITRKKIREAISELILMYGKQGVKT